MRKKYAKILSIILVFSVMLTITACENPEEEAKKTVDTSFSALQTCDLDEIEKDFDGIENLSNIFSDSGSTKDSEKGKDTLNDEQKTVFIESAFKNFKYEILEAKKKDNNTVNVKVKVTNVNMSTVVSKWYVNIFTIAFSNYDKSEKEIAKLILNDFTSEVSKAAKDKDYKSSEITVEVIKQKDGWAVNPSKKVINAILGNFISATESLTDK